MVVHVCIMAVSDACWAVRHSQLFKCQFYYQASISGISQSIDAVHDGHTTLGYTRWNPYTPYGRHYLNLHHRECRFQTHLPKWGTILKSALPLWNFTWISTGIAQLSHVANSVLLIILIISCLGSRGIYSTIYSSQSSSFFPTLSILDMCHVSSPIINEWIAKYTYHSFSPPFIFKMSDFLPHFENDWVYSLPRKHGTFTLIGCCDRNRQYHCFSLHAFEIKQINIGYTFEWCLGAKTHLLRLPNTQYPKKLH